MSLSSDGSIVAIGAFMNQQYGEFETFTNSIDASQLVEQHVELLSVLEDMKVKWAREQPVREAETAKDDLPQVVLRTSTGDVVFELLSCEIEGTTALAKVRDKYLGITFLDTLSFIKVDDRWQLYTKLFNVESE